MANAVHVPYPGKTRCQPGLCGQKMYDPPVPFGHKLGHLYPGKMIFISGIPDSDSPRFSINFKGEETNAFHFDVRFDYGSDQNEIVRNAKVDGSWGTEEKSLDKPFPFGRGKFFDMIVLIERDCFKVAVNNEHLLEFEYRFPIEKVDTLRIRGDVRLCLVRVQG